MNPKTMNPKTMNPKTMNPKTMNPKTMNPKTMNPMTTNAVGIAELKARLSHHLRTVRQGHPLTVMDRDQPVATLVPFKGDESLRSRKPVPGAPSLQDLPLPPPLDLDIDIVDLLLVERQAGR